MTTPQPPDTGSADLERLLRWEGAGGTWQVLSYGPHGVTISLCRCDGGEEMSRLTSADELVLQHLAGRTRSDD